MSDTTLLPTAPARASRTIRMHERDNVAIVANDGGLAAGTTLPSRPGAVRSRAARPQGGAGRHRGRCAGAALRHPDRLRAEGHRRGQLGARAPAEDARRARARRACRSPPSSPQPLPPLEGYTFEGYRNADGSVGTRNILAITQTVQCVAGVTEFAVQRIKAELLPRFPNVDDVVALEHSYGCGVAIDAPDAVVPIRTLRNISLNPNFGGEVMVVSLGCEKLQPERLLPPGTFAIVDERQRRGTRHSMSSACRTTRTSASCRWSSRSCARPSSTSNA